MPCHGLLRSGTLSGIREKCHIRGEGPQACSRPPSLECPSQRAGAGHLGHLGRPAYQAAGGPAAPLLSLLRVPGRRGLQCDRLEGLRAGEDRSGGLRPFAPLRRRGGTIR